MLIFFLIVIFGPGVQDKVCTNADCCKANQCAHGSKCDDDPNDPTVSKWGYKCNGCDRSQYMGLFCDVPKASACDKCNNEHKGATCIGSGQTPSGYMCYVKQANGDFLITNRRELDILYGEGAGLEMERIATEEIGNGQQKQNMRQLVRELLDELQNA